MNPGDQEEFENVGTSIIYWDRILVAVGKAIAILIVAALIYAVGYLSAARRPIYIPPQQLYPTSDNGRTI